MNEIAQNIAEIKARMAEACKKAGRNPEEVKLLLATKTVPADRIKLALATGETLIGENKVQELRDKYEELEKSFAIVGTRRPSKEGIDFARDIGQYLSKNSIYNISGLALGIDTVGHNMSLQKTGAILGQGLDLEIYPRENINLAKMILENNGFLLSELIPKQELSIFSLIKRDRLQSALTSGIIIAESGIKGGTVNTFKYAKEQKKKIFIADINKDFIEKYGKDLIIIKNSFDFEKKIKNNLEQINLF